MKTRGLAWVGVVATVAATACGGRTEAIEGRGSSGDDAGDHGDGGPSDAAPTPSPTPTPTSTSQPGPGPTPVGDDEIDAEVDASPVVACTLGPAGGSSSGGGCEIEGQESCSDGNTYQVSCECPAATCSCEVTFGSGSGMGGGSSAGGSFSGCPVCPSLEQAWSLCGFPQ